MATETAERRSAHVRGLKVTAIATIGGVLSGMAAAALTAGPGDRLGLAVGFGAILAELAVMRLAGIEVEDFSAKDNLYVGFMSLSLWFITWSIFLTTDAL